MDSFNFFSRLRFDIVSLVALFFLLITPFIATHNSISAQETPPFDGRAMSLQTAAEGVGLDLDTWVQVCQLPASDLSHQSYLDGRAALESQTVPTRLNRVQSSDFQIVFDDTYGAWSNDAKTALTHSAEIWGQILESDVPVTIRAYYAPLGSGILGGAYSQNNYINNETYYATALFNSIAGFDTVPSQEDIIVFINSNGINWYFGTDGNPGPFEYDLVSVMLHEIGHGIGFYGGMEIENGLGTYGTYPVIYDRFTETGSEVPLLSYSKNSFQLTDALTGGDLYFDGPMTRAQSEGNRAEIYAPSSWNNGSSYSHLDNIYNGTDNALMTFSIGRGVAEHDPGPVMLGILADIGWTVPSIIAPEIESRFTMVEDGVLIDNAFDLYSLSSDNSADNTLIFSLQNGSNSAIQTTIDSNRYIDITTTGVGSLEVTITATDPDGNEGSGTLTIYSVSQIESLFAPFIDRE